MEELEQENELNTDLAIRTLAIGKRIGLTFEEINILRVTDLFELANDYLGKKNDGPRMATQDDIDAFFRG